ncbi:hypothetical protein GCM10010129_46970 [Streptomyces fumigatiscleroticus]|nr:hypothetical protein GCM10010129_46970 [Streptomyces fumigatiscleroticus]
MAGAFRMSVDGRDGSPEDGAAEGGGPPQVPGQGGRPGLPGGGGSGAGAVPAQRDRRGDGVPPPLWEPPPAPEPPPSDAELLRRMRSGDDTAYEELYRRHAQALRRYARTCCRDPHTADDLTAEVFARMLQAVRGGSGPEHAVRAYLLTAVRHVAAAWTRSARREQLVDDFAVFAAQAARVPELSDEDTVDLGADVRAMREAERSLALRAFRSLPERWQAVLWHTEVEDESPSEVATLFGLDANGTRVLASRAREGLKQAYLQAHVSVSPAGDEECARHADRLGTYARGRLRTRAERGLRKHLEGCARCRLAASQIEEVAGGIPAVVPVAVIGWFGAAGYAKAAGLVAAGAGAGAAAGSAGAAAAAGGSSAGAGGAGGTAGSGATAGGGASGGAGAGGGAAASEGLGAPAKAGLAVGLAAAAAAAVALTLIGDDSPAGRRPRAAPPASAPVVRPGQSPPAPTRRPPAPRPPVTLSSPAPTPTPSRTSTPAPAPTPTPTPTPDPRPTPTPDRTPAPASPPAPAPPPLPAVYRWSELTYDLTGDGTGPEMRLGASSWVWQRYGVSIGGARYPHGVTVHGASSVTLDLNRPCSSYDALVGVDDSMRKLGRLRFAVHADGVRLWRSHPVRGGETAVPVHVDLAGRRTVRLVVEPLSPFDTVALADWAQSRFSCG